jgi:hypothetical protein
MIRIRIFQELSEFCSLKDYVESENDRCKVQLSHSLLKDINSLRVRIFVFRFFIDSKDFR